METLAYNGTLYYLPATNADVTSLVQQAMQQNVKIRVRGSGHSFPPGIILQPTDDPNSANQPINVMLSKMRQVTIGNQITVDGTSYTLVTAQAGCNLGIDPFDITGISTLENSLLYQLQQVNLSLPDLGGITHQALGGFSCMGCAGGSLTHGFDEAIYSITIIPANSANPQPVTYTYGTDNFYAAGVSMGLLGIIVEMQLLASPTFNISGSEVVGLVGQDTQVDLFGTSTVNPAPPNLQTWLQNTEYTRIIWWPQNIYGANATNYTSKLNGTRSVVWNASRISPEPNFKPNPYKEVQPWLGTELLPEAAAGTLYSLIGKWPSWLRTLSGIIGNPTMAQYVNAIATASPQIQNWVFYSFIMPAVLDMFVSTKQDGQPDPQSFQDYWYTGLPMDNQMNDALFPVWFTELWIDINDAQNVMTTLGQIYNDYYNNGLYNDNNMNPLIPNGAFSVEIYGAKSSNFWLSPSYGTNVVRVDVMWIGRNNSNPSVYYNMFWEQLKKYNFRAHWAKYNPNYSSPEWSNYLQSVYPKLDAFLALRAANDPQKVFVNDDWAQQFGL